MKLLKKYRGFVLTMSFLLIAQLAYSHVTRIRVKQNQNGTLTWRVETYHNRGQCGIANSGIRINGVSYPLQSEGSMNESNRYTLPNDGFSLFANASSNALYGYQVALRSYGQVTTPYIPGTLNVQPYSSNACWAFSVGGNGSFTPPPPPVCTSFPVTGASNTLGTATNNNTECDASDDSIPVNLTVNHLVCGNITGDGKFSAYLDPNGVNTFLGNVDYSSGITTPLNFTLPANVNAQVRFVDNDFPSNSFTYSITGLGGNSFAGLGDSTPPVVSVNNVTLNLDDNGNATILSNTTKSNLITETFSNDTPGVVSSLVNWNVNGTVDVGNYISTNNGTEIDLAGNSNAILTSKSSYILTAGDYELSFDHLENNNPSGGNSVNIKIGNVFNQTFNSPSTAQRENVTFTVNTAETAVITLTQLGTNDAAGSFIGDFQLSKILPSYLIYNNASDACGIANISVSKSNFDCSNVGNNIVTLTVTDVNGNSTSKTANVTVVDNIAPSSISVSQDSTINIPSGSTNGWNPWVHTFNLPIPVNAEVTGVSLNFRAVDQGWGGTGGYATFQVADQTIGSSQLFHDERAYTINYNGSIPNYNNSGSNQLKMFFLGYPGWRGYFKGGTMTISYNANAEANNVTVFLDENGNASVNASDVDPGIIDNCGIESRVLNVSEFNCSNIGVNNIVLTVTDVNDNSSNFPSIVTVIDNIAPTVITNDIPVELDANGNAAITPEMIDNGSSDACGIASYSLNLDTFSCNNVGANEVILTVTDNNGNAASSNATVTVSDVTAPNVITNDIPVTLDANGNVTITPEMIDNGSSDACGIASYSLNLDTFSCTNVGANEVILTVTDNNGNAASLNATVTISDVTAPNVITNDIPVELDANGNATITPEMIDNGSTDACGIASYSLDIDTFSCDNVGANEVILTVTDNNGNSAYSNATVTIIDVTVPNVITNDIPVTLDANGNVTITPEMIDNGSSDACGIASYSLDIDTFDCSNTGENTVMLTVTDNNGNSAASFATVTVTDTIAPTVITQSYSIDLANGVADITPNDIDGGTFDNCDFTLAIDKDHFTCDDIGDHVVTLTATDASNNTTSSTAVVSVVGDIPSISIDDFYAVNTQKVNTIFLGFGPQSINLNTNTTGGNRFTYDWTSSTGEFVSNEANPSISPQVSTTYNVTVTNSNGCTAATSIDVCVIDARAFDKKGKYKGKVTVCHHTSGKKGTKHVQINISASAVMTHLTKHGVGTDHADTLGACNAVCVDGSTNRSASKKASNTISIADNILIYPNPSIGVFDIKLTAINLKTDILLFDTSGKLIESKSISKENSAENIITIGNYNLASGMYMVKIITQNETITKKLMIQK